MITNQGLGNQARLVGTRGSLLGMVSRCCGERADMQDKANVLICMQQCSCPDLPAPTP